MQSHHRSRTRLSPRRSLTPLPSFFTISYLRSTCLSTESLIFETLKVHGGYCQDSTKPRDSSAEEGSLPSNSAVLRASEKNPALEHRAPVRTSQRSQAPPKISREETQLIHTEPSPLRGVCGASPFALKIRRRKQGGAKQPWNPSRHSPNLHVGELRQAKVSRPTRGQLKCSCNQAYVHPAAQDSVSPEIKYIRASAFHEAAKRLEKTSCATAPRPPARHLAAPRNKRRSRRLNTRGARWCSDSIKSLPKKRRNAEKCARRVGRTLTAAVQERRYCFLTVSCSRRQRNFPCREPAPSVSRRNF